MAPAKGVATRIGLASLLILASTVQGLCALLCGAGTCCPATSTAPAAVHESCCPVETQGEATCCLGQSDIQAESKIHAALTPAPDDVPLALPTPVADTFGPVSFAPRVALEPQTRDLRGESFVPGAPRAPPIR